MNKNMLARIAVAAVFIPLILWICYQGSVFLRGMIYIFSLIAAVEFLWQEKFRPTNFLFWLTLLTTSLLFNEYNGFAYLEISIFLGYFLITAMVLAIGKETPEILFNKLLRLLFAVVYIGLLYPMVVKAAYKLDAVKAPFETSGDWLLFLFAILWVGDSAALFVGKAIGKHKLAPTVSPNKTVEGFVGGLLGAAIIGVVMMFWKFDWLEWYHVIILALGCSLFGQLGDLVESMWKRSLGIKDSSNIIPGHGGILDRFDSLLFAAPFMYFYKLYFLM